MCFARHKKRKRRNQSPPEDLKDESKTSPNSKKDEKNDGETKAPKEDNSTKLNDETAKKMSADNTLKEVPNRMPEMEFLHPRVAETVYSEDQLL
ncbi:unnamed protein product [Bursaphelenchus xylophilus]|uniref:(pine wood nematode) hypothetical protein n=1 Tax=Bursaphelenchus xylophilus TaxID=6326 RepID=A0A1I7RRS9_BURXY|nr:unnamed protein product [Bursaphelenchus xylophilus]CAG9123499.1 unnamed protein product [Bursaphelenchus xylophilus]